MNNQDPLIQLEAQVKLLEECIEDIQFKLRELYMVVHNYVQ